MPKNQRYYKADGMPMDRLSVDLSPEQQQQLKELQALLVARQPGLASCTQAHAIRFAITFAHQSLTSHSDRRGT